MQVVALVDESGKLDAFDLGNYLLPSHMKDPISRIDDGMGIFCYWDHHALCVFGLIRIN